MKRTIFTILVSVFCTIGFVKADDVPITTKQLPQQAQNFLNEYYKGVKVLLATHDNDFFDNEYEVVLADGTKVEFDNNGRWESISQRGKAILPQLVPPQIAEFVNQHYATVIIQKIQRDRRGYEVDLSNGLELKFDTAMRLVEIDD